MNLNMNSSNGSNGGIGMVSSSGMKTPGSSLSNEILNAPAASHHGLSIQPNGHHGIMQPHHFLAAAAAAGLLSAHHPAVNGHRLFDSSNGQPSQQLGLSPSSVTGVNGQLPPASTMNPFIKQLYGEITPPSSSSSSSSSSTSSSCHRSDQTAQQHQHQHQHHHHHNLHNQQHQHQNNDSNSHHFNSTSLNEKSNAENEHSLLHVNSRRSSIQTMSALNSTSSSLSSSAAIKRPFEHLDQNLNENNSKQHKLLFNAYSNEIKETMAKKLAIDTLLLNNNNNNSKSSSSTPHNENHLSQSPSSPKMKIKILSKSKFFYVLFHSQNFKINF
jgi:hypothetical protein